MVREKQVRYVREQLKKGVNQKRLREVLLSYDYSKAQIDELFAAVKQDADGSTAPVKKATPPPNKKQITYIQRQRQRGLADDAIADLLKESGYKDEQIQTLLQAASETKKPNQSTKSTTTQPAPATSPQSAETNTKRAAAAPTSPPPLVGYGTILKEGWVIAIREIGALGAFVTVFLLLTAVAAAVVVAGTMAVAMVPTMSDQVLTIASWSLATVGVVLAGLCFFAAVVALLRRLLHRRYGLSFWNHFVFSWHFVVSAVLVTIYTHIVMAVGFVALIIPGIILSVYLVFVLYALAGEERRGLEVLIRSIDIVYGHWWAVFGRVFLLGVIGAVFPALATALFFLVESGVVFPPLVLAGIAVVLVLVGLGLTFWVTSASVVLFESLQRLHPASVFDSQHHGVLKWWLRILMITAVIVTLGCIIGVWLQQSRSLPVENRWSLSAWQGTISAALPWIPSMTNTDTETETETTSVPVDEREVAMKQALTVIKLSTMQAISQGENDYSGVCDTDVVAQAQATLREQSISLQCASATDTFVVEAEYASGHWLCIDAIGWHQTTTTSRAATGSCLDPSPEPAT